MSSNKIKNIYSCTQCGAQFPKWSGRCLECGAWGTLKQDTKDEKEAAKADFKTAKGEAEIISLDNLEITKENRMNTGLEEVDRVTGGGLVEGSLTLLSGEPGVGKSTLIAQIADNIAKDNKVIYVSGEESASQIKGRLTRLNCDLANINFISETNLEKTINSIGKVSPALVIIDSIQTIYSSLVDSEAGNVSQIKAATIQFLELAKKNNIAIILIGHITKEGSVAGPKSLEHIVDSVIYLEADIGKNYSILRSNKNRFGSINEIGVLEMTGEGFKEIKDPSSIFMEENQTEIPGSVVSCVIEGSRPFLVNVQALVSKTLFGYPQRKASGFDLNRLQVLSAVVSKRAKVNLATQDIILNLVGGLKIKETALDLAVCTAIISSVLNQKVANDVIILGEVGLGGEIRSVFNLEKRLKEAEKLGFKVAFIPSLGKKKINLKTSLELVEIKELSHLTDIIKKGDF